MRCRNRNVRAVPRVKQACSRKEAQKAQTNFPTTLCFCAFSWLEAVVHVTFVDRFPKAHDNSVFLRLEVPTLQAKLVGPGLDRGVFSQHDLFSPNIPKRKLVH